MSARRTLPAALSGLTALLLTVTACGYGSRADEAGPAGPAGSAGSAGSTAGASAGTGSGSAPAGRTTSAAQVRIGYFANLTHATPLVGTARGFFTRQLGRTTLRQQVFNAGPAEIEAINSGAVDMGWIGPSPAINGYAKSHGRALRIIAGATSGGASLVVNPARVASAEDLTGKRLATPQLGNTQDVALRSWLADHHHPVDRTGRGTVTVQPTPNAETLNAFRRGDIDGAWLPEPWASRLVVEAGAKVLVDERSLWPHGRFVTTNLVVSTSFLARHPDTVEAVLRGQVAADAWINRHPAQARKTVNDRLAALAGKPLKPAVLRRAWSRLTVTDDPLAATLRTQARHAERTGLVNGLQLPGIYRLGPLNKVLKAVGRGPVPDAGLGG